MKARIPRLIVRTAFVLAAVAMAYMAGVSQRIEKEETQAAAREQAIHKAALAKQEPAVLTRAQALQELQLFLQGKYPMGLDHIVERVNPLDLPFLIEQVCSLLGEEKDYRHIFESLFKKLRAVDPAAALALSGKISDPDQRTEQFNNALEALAEKDLALAFAELDKLPPDLGAAGPYCRVYQVWASQPEHFSEVAAAALALPPGEARSGALRGVALSSDYEDALRFASALLPENPSILTDAIKDAVPKVPQLAASFVENIQDVKARNETIEYVTAHWGDDLGDNSNMTPWEIRKTAAPMALDWLNEVATGTTYDHAVQDIFRHVSGMEDAPALLEKVTGLDLRAQMINGIASDWTGGREAGIAWAQSLPDADRAAGDSAAALILSRWWSNEPAAAAAYVQNLPDQSLFLAAASNIANYLVADSPKAALEFVQNLPDGSNKDMALSSALYQIAQFDFSTAWNYALNLPADPKRDATLNGLVITESMNDPAAAAGIISQIPAGPAQIEATNTFAAAWAQQNPKALAGWLANQPAGDLRDAATVQLISAQSASNPNSALELANSISDPQTKAAQVELVQLTMQLTTLPNGSQRDALLLQVIQHQAPTDVEDALYWAMTISDPKVRASTRDKLLTALNAKSARQYNLAP